MKISEIKDLSIDELKLKEKSLVEELFKLRFRFATGQLDSSAAMRNIRKDVARVKTVLREKGV
ncbi:MAG: 50S ribosomal protein L29 [Syntrophobacterales bacterium]|jgi:large subunit ribosomal protein L29|nr:MAG: 50S ribosomal protein L29 [Syntrophobacterales bacterium]